MELKNSKKVWTTQEDNLLTQLMSIGLNSKVIYERYGNVFGRSEKAIQLRITYLNKTPEERAKDDMEEMASRDEIIEKMETISERLCNRLDTLTRQNEEMKKQIIEMNESNEKRCDAYLKALYEIKTSASENAGDTKVIKNEVKRLAHKLVR